MKIDRVKDNQTLLNLLLLIHLTGTKLQKVYVPVLTTFPHENNSFSSFGILPTNKTSIKHLLLALMYSNLMIHENGFALFGMVNVSARFVPESLYFAYCCAKIFY